jgi:hypothetical protein
MEIKSESQKFERIFPEVIDLTLSPPEIPAYLSYSS